MALHKLSPAPHSTHSKKRRGRGSSSGLGGSAGRGEKGYHSRSGSRHKRGFEGGQMPIHRRLPKRGFHNLWAAEVQIVNLRDLARLPEGTVVEPESLKRAKLIRSVSVPVKILGTGDVSRAYEIRGCRISAAAQEKIAAAGGKVVAD